MVRTSEKARIYEIADKFRSQCLTESRSLLWPDHRIWTVENLTAFRDAFIKHPDEGDRTFSQKLHDQLSGASEDIHRLAADILAIYQLFPSDWTVTSKISNIETIVGWKLAEDQPVYASIRSAYEAKGIGGTGQWYAQGRPWHIAYYIDFSIHAISGRLDPADENSSRLGADFLADRQPNVNLSRNILLHLMFPDEYEKIASQRQKRQITKVFSQFKGDTDIVDHQIANIRGELAKEHGPGFDFYDSEILKLWNPSEPRSVIQNTMLDATWTSEAFTLLEQLHLNPTAEFYHTHREEFKQSLQQPFKNLLGAVVQRLRPEITELMETEKRISSRIVKNDYGRGGAWDFYWGAFYPIGSKRTESAQLFLGMHEDYLEFGFYIGEYGSEQRSRFTKHCSLHLEILENILREPLSRDDLVFGETAATGDYRSKPVPGLKGNEWLNQIEQARIRAAVRLSRSEVQVMSDDTLAEHIADVFHDLFPLVLLATKDDPLIEIRRYVGEILFDDETLNPEYSLEQCATETHFDLEVLQRWVRAVERKKQAIFYGPPGTGKTFVAEKLARHLIGGSDGFSEIVQFHPSYAYEDFMQGLRPHALSGGGLEYVMTPGRFKDFCDRARESKGPCVLIIDEINRANLSRVLGELMFLLEYRDQSVPLSGGGRFQIPANIRIIGTMNTADRSISLVDHALRRRFSFLELRPNYEVLRRYHANTGFDPEGLINLLQRLNAAINDRHYSVGISFFLSPSIEKDVADIWQMELEPYIEEHFFDQPDKAASFEWDKVKEEIVG